MISERRAICGPDRTSQRMKEIPHLVRGNLITQKLMHALVDRLHRFARASTPQFPPPRKNQKFFSPAPTLDSYPSAPHHLVCRWLKEERGRFWDLYFHRPSSLQSGRTNTTLIVE